MRCFVRWDYLNCKEAVVSELPLASKTPHFELAKLLEAFAHLFELAELLETLVAFALVALVFLMVHVNKKYGA